MLFRSYRGDSEVSLVRSCLLIDWLLVGVACILQGGCLRYATIFTVWSLVVLPVTLNATPLLHPSIHMILWYTVSLVSIGLLLLFWSCFELYPILEGTLLAAFLAVVLAGVLVSSLKLSSDDAHTDELLAPFIRILMEVFIERHSAAEGTCELIVDDIDYCPVWYFSIGIQLINLI